MIENKRLLLPYVAPYFAYTAIASIFSDVVSKEINYVLRILVTGGLLYWARNWYISFSDSKPVVPALCYGFVFGLVGCVVWIVLLLPFAGESDAAPWSIAGFLLRLFSAGLLVPIFEELMIRGFSFRLAYQWDECRRKGIDEPLSTALHERSINTWHQGDWSWAAVAISTLVFMIGHAVIEWPAAVAYSLLLSYLLIRTNLLACIIAHGVTNIMLAGYIYLTGSWQLW
jgi:hypothetical protein